MTIERRIEITETKVEYPFRTDIKSKRTSYEREIIYYCTVCEEEYYYEENNNDWWIGKCQNHPAMEGCCVCLSKCGMDDFGYGDDHQYKVKGCGQIFCHECYNRSPFNGWYPPLCKKCQKKNNVEKYYGARISKKHDKIMDDKKLSSDEKSELIDKLYYSL